MPKFVTFQNLEQYNDKIYPKIKNLETDVGQVVDPATHMPIEATTASVGVVQLATAQDITNGTANKVVDAKELADAIADIKLADSSKFSVVAGANIDATGIPTVAYNNGTFTFNYLKGAKGDTGAQGPKGDKGDTGATGPKGDTPDSIAWDKVSGKPSTYTPSSHTHDDRYYTEGEIDTKLNNLNVIKKNDGNDYYDDSDITSLIYAGNGEGTIRNEIANGNFSRVHPGQTIIGKVTGTTYVVVGCNIYKHRGDTELTSNHIGLMPIQLIGNDGNLLWSGRTYAGSGVNNTTQGYAPWASDNDTEGKNQTSCYKDSYIANTVLPKVDNLWLKPDFENQGISVLTFRNLEATSFDTNAVCMSNPNWRGCATNWGWASKRLVLPSEPEIYGHYHWSGSPWESGSPHTQLPLYRHKEIHKVYPRVDIWLKDSASASIACNVHGHGVANHTGASSALRVCPLFLIA